MKTIELTDEKFEEIKDQLGEVKGIDSYEDLVGGKYFFRTVSYHLVGKVAKVVGKFLFLKEASWVADSGRFSNAIKNGELDEVEVVGNAYLNLETIVDFFPWQHSLPSQTK